MSSLLQELKRRNIFRVAAVYAVVSWLVIQIAGEILPTFEAPLWINQTIILLLALGFPLALILAWAYEIAPAAPGSDLSPQQGNNDDVVKAQRFNSIILGLMALAVCFLLLDRYVLESRLAPTNSLDAAVSDQAVQVTRIPMNLGLLNRSERTGVYTEIAISPDGSQIAYVKFKEGVTEFYLRQIDQLDARLLDISRNNNNDFVRLSFSPDGESLLFFDGASLRSVNLSGGPDPTILQNVPLHNSGIFWKSDSNILYKNLTDSELYSMPLDGDSPIKLLESSAESEYQVSPSVLPGGNLILFQAGSVLPGLNDERIDLLNIETGVVRTIVQSGGNARYTSSGHIVFIRAGALWAVPFDIDEIRTTGREVQLITDIYTANRFAYASYDFSENGRLIYVPRDTRQRNEGSQLIWVDRGGQESPIDLDFQTAGIADPQISPDGNHLSFTIFESGLSSDIWNYELDRSQLSRVTTTGRATSGVWSPDGSNLFYTSVSDGIWQIPTNGTSDPSRITRLGEALRHAPFAFSTDGNHLIYRELTGGQGTADLLVLALDQDQESLGTELLATPFVEGWTSMSPNGKWIAYESNETGRDEVYVRPFPNVDDRKWQISSNGGKEPNWSQDGDELFFLDDIADNVMVVAVETENAFSAGIPEPLFGGNYKMTGRPPTYAVHPDGEQFLMIEEELLEQQTSIVVVENWFEELKRLAPPDLQ